MLEEKLTELKVKLAAAETKVEQFKAAHSIFDSGHILSEQQLSKLMEQTVTARNATAEARAKYEQIKKLVQKGDGSGMFGDVLQSQTVRQMKEQLGIAQRREAELMTKYGPNHPDMRKVRAEVHEARANLDAEMERLVANVRNEYEVAEERERQLLANLNTLKAQELSVKGASIELKELEREATTASNCSRRCSHATSRRPKPKVCNCRRPHRGASGRTVYPAFPKRKQLAIAGLVGGLTLGIALALLIEVMTPGIGRLEDVEHALDMTHLSSLPQTQGTTATAQIEPLRSVRLVVADPAGPFAEAIRGVRREIDVRRRVALHV